MQYLQISSKTNLENITEARVYCTKPNDRLTQKYDFQLALAVRITSERNVRGT